MPDVRSVPRDTRGYTYGLIVEYDTPRWPLCGAEALMPAVANGIVLDWHVAQSRGENVEFELHPTSPLTVRLLGYANHANMGRYTEAIDAHRAGQDPIPNIEAHREQGRIKYGVGANTDYTMPSRVGLFARTGWNSGDSESFALTEVNNTVAIGGDISGTRWHRRLDRASVAVVSNGLSAPHREYLALGCLGFLLSAMADCGTVVRTSSKPTTRPTCGEAYRHLADSSTSITPIATRIAGRCSWKWRACTWTSDRVLGRRTALGTLRVQIVSARSRRRNCCID